jgi:hypothetical protein
MRLTLEFASALVWQSPLAASKGAFASASVPLVADEDAEEVLNIFFA